MGGHGRGAWRWHAAAEWITRPITRSMSIGAAAVVALGLAFGLVATVWPERSENVRPVAGADAERGESTAPATAASNATADASDGGDASPSPSPSSDGSASGDASSSPSPSGDGSASGDASPSPSPSGDTTVDGDASGDGPSVAAPGSTGLTQPASPPTTRPARGEPSVVIDPPSDRPTSSRPSPTRSQPSRSTTTDAPPPRPDASPSPTAPSPTRPSDRPAPTSPASPSTSPAPVPPTTSPSTTPDPSPVSGAVVWQDDFDSLDRSRWAVEHSTYGDGNNELQCYRPENVSVANGRLVLRAVTETYTCPNGSTRQVTSGMVRSRGVLFEPGQAVEFRVKLTPADHANQGGLWPAVWSSGWAGGGWPRGGEMDYLEVMTANDPRRSIYSIHYAKPDGSHGVDNRPVIGADDFSNAWHTVRFEYGEGGRLVWYLDGRQVHSVYGVGTAQGYPAPFDQAVGEIKINLALGGRPGPLDPRAVGSTGATFEIDYIRVVRL